jgi:hypothetical protein
MSMHIGPEAARAIQALALGREGAGLRIFPAQVAGGERFEVKVAMSEKPGPTEEVMPSTGPGCSLMGS